MTKVFVHGNPETDAIWRPLRAALAERGVTDTVALSPPGFGAPVPVGFDASPGAYVTWLADELRSIDGPIDLVGHDWGAGHVLGLVAAHPDLLRSWAADCVGLIHPDYVWHDGAQAWQTPEVGEEVTAMMMNMPMADRMDAFTGLGMPTDIAQDVVSAFGDEMGDCILKLYRGAAQPFLVELGQRVLAADRPPGLVIAAVEDEYVPVALAEALTPQLNAQQMRLEGQGHWWMLQNVDDLAAQMIDFWEGVQQ